MKKLTLLICLLSLLMLAACGSSDNNQESNGGSDGVPSIVEVEIKLPETIEPNEEVKIQALVTQGDENVEDANEVTFEVWKQGQEADHEMLEADHDGDGIYSITKTFDEEGYYYVVAHTTAREMHVMPRVEVTVGNPDPSEKEEAANSHEHSDEGHHHDHETHEETDHDDHHSHGHEHENTLHMTLQHADTVTANQETTLSTELKQGETSFTGAEVRFEIWHEDSENHEFIEAEEVSDGKYEAKATMNESGLHYVQIHVEKDELHEHQMEELEVK
ncbi:FixH family protein [Sutcliffiella horikoshii]|uniref:FixH family protein n=1 Tax=Sutcliffiella horikoshii TaxID=79883 RepID=UPI00204235C7|nr:FixH family protein [Sutcliffiella horikoshii]MCM3617114.1 FixH family protein [Sutcliffiella horikoshii]